MNPHCDHCGRRPRKGKMRQDPRDDNWYCPPCWERFGGRKRRPNRDTTKRRATGQ